MFLILFRNILCPQQMFLSLRSPRNIMGNNVSAKRCPLLAGLLVWLNEISPIFRLKRRYFADIGIMILGGEMLTKYRRYFERTVCVIRQILFEYVCTILY